MIDETFFGPEDAVKAIKHGIADIINLKVCKDGGLFQSKKIAGMAEDLSPLFCCGICGPGLRLLRFVSFIQTPGFPDEALTGLRAGC